MQAAGDVPNISAAQHNADRGFPTLLRDEGRKAADAFLQAPSMR